MLKTIINKIKNLIDPNFSLNQGTITSGLTQSIWLDSAERDDYPKLTQNINVDVCIIGGGIAGITTAYCLLREGKTVAVLEDGKIASGESGRTTAHLSNALDDRYTEIIKVHGLEGARLAANSHTAAINFIEEIVRTENIACDFTRLDGYLFSENNAVEEIESEYQAAQDAGLTEVYLQEEVLENTFAMGKRLVFPNQAQFHPLKYLCALAKLIVNRGGQIYENVHAESFQQSNQMQEVKTNTGYSVFAKSIVIATNVPINDKILLHSKQEPNRTYVIGASVPRGAIKKALYWDIAEPYHYVRLYRNEALIDEPDILIIGGEDHRTGVAPDYDPFERLESWARERFPQIMDIRYAWSGQVIEPVDYLAFIGRNPLDNNIYIASGDSGNGMTSSTIAGLLLTDLISGRENSWAKLYDPSRKSLTTIGDFALHNLKAAKAYIDYATPGEVNSVNDIQPGHGAIVRQGLKKIAAYRDEAGNLHLCSAVCPHLQAVVQWNPIEQTWDCPAHGSRFTVSGQVINGPANCPLAAEGKR